MNFITKTILKSTGSSISSMASKNNFINQIGNLRNSQKHDCDGVPYYQNRRRTINQGSGAQKTNFKTETIVKSKESSTSSMVSKNSFINYEAVRVMIVMESIVINIGGTKEMVWRIDRLNCFMKLVCKTILLLMGYY